jgi:hypothetical protein
MPAVAEPSPVGDELGDGRVDECPGLRRAQQFGLLSAPSGAIASSGSVAPVGKAAAATVASSGSCGAGRQSRRRRAHTLGVSRTAADRLAVRGLVDEPDHAPG